MADRIEVIRAPSTEIELPERADVIVSDLRGVTPFHGHHLEAGGRHAAPTARARAASASRAATSSTRRSSRTTRCTRAPSARGRACRTRSRTSRSTRSWRTAGSARARRARSSLSEPSPFVTLDYDCPTPSLHARWEAHATRDGTAHGLAALVRHGARCRASSCPTRRARRRRCTGRRSSPSVPRFALRRGDRLRVELRAVLAGDDYAWSWMARRRRGPRRAPHDAALAPARSRGARAPLGALRAAPLATEGEIIRALLDAADGSATFGELAQLLHERFPERFPTAQSALDYASRLDDLWAR